MKTFLLIVLAGMFSINANAKNFTLNKRKNNAQEFQKYASVFKNKVVPASTLVSVPRLIKESSWDNNMMAWSPNNAMRKVYQNDLLVAEYNLNYALTDTASSTIYTYNADKKLTSIVSSYNTGVALVPFNRYTFTYSNNYLKENALSEMYNEQTNQWLPQSRSMAEYNVYGMQTAGVYESYNNNTWEIMFAFKANISYLNSTTDKITEYVDSSYNVNTMQYEIDYREQRLYTSNGEVTDILVYYGTGFNSVYPAYRDSLNYSAGVISSIIEFDYDTTLNAYIKSTKVDNINWINFNPNTDIYNNEADAYTESIWDNNSWLLDNRSSTTYPDNYGSTIYIEQMHDGTNWVNTVRTQLINDEKRNRINQYYELYDPIVGNWQYEFGERIFYTYDLMNNIAEDYNENYNNNVSQWIKSVKHEYAEYITINTGVNTYKNTIETKLYPNPSNNGTVSIQVNLLEASVLNIKITDVKGSLVYSEQKELGKGINTIEMNGLQKGMYFVELNTEYGIAISKLIVR